MNEEALADARDRFRSAERSLVAACDRKRRAERAFREAQREKADAGMASCRVAGGVMPPGKIPSARRLSELSDRFERARAGYETAEQGERRARHDVEEAQRHLRETREALVMGVGGWAEYARMRREEAAGHEEAAAAARHEVAIAEQQSYRPATVEERRAQVARVFAATRRRRMGVQT